MNFKRFNKKVLDDCGITEDSTNVSGLLEEPTPYQKLMLDLAEEAYLKKRENEEKVSILNKKRKELDLYESNSLHTDIVDFSSTSSSSSSSKKRKPDFFVDETLSLKDFMNTEATIELEKQKLELERDKMKQMERIEEMKAKSEERRDALFQEMMIKFMESQNHLVTLLKEKSNS